MEMPALRARASGLSTRRANQDIRPAVAAGLEKKTRRTAVQMDQARADDTTSKAKASLEEKKKQKRVADLEDKQRQDDLAYAKTANHPADRPVASSTVGPETDSEAGGAVDPVDDSDPVDDLEAEAYKPDDEASSESESTPEDSSEDDAPKRKQKQKKKKKKRSTSRADVIASRATQDSSGTPEEPVKKRKATEEKTSKKDKKTKTSNSGKKSGLDKIGVGLKVAATVAEDDSMVAQGGPALDDDSKEHVERPNGKKGKSKTGQPAPVIAIQPVPSKAPSRTAQRQGAAKWTLKHLPSGTSDEFTNELVPLARDLAGTLPPWTGLTVKQIQGLADRVYGPGVHTVTLESAWVGLIGYRLSDWRSGIASQATRGIEALIAAACASEDVSEYDSDYADDNTLDSGAAGGAVPTDPAFVEEGADAASASASASAPAPPAAAADGAPDATVAPKVQKFTFDTPVGISAFVEWALEPHESGTMPFHWKTWGGGVDKKGFLKSHLIAYTYAYHLTCLAAIPGAYTMTRPGDPPKPKSQPVGALILSVQAVQRALQFWRTGEYVNTGKTTSYFSVENWGDHAVEDKKGSERRLVRRATKYLRSVQQWDEAHWEELKAAASVFVEVASRKRAGSSRSASEAGDDLMLDDDVIILSD
ncbi:hypothetical protein DFH09DRAFT_1086817 [Mycena vulgaris]|nr:hypothetical protein DFH09DRAFT_1086817 [Mycena vulgaris]